MRKVSHKGERITTGVTGDCRTGGPSLECYVQARAISSTVTLRPSPSWRRKLNMRRNYEVFRGKRAFHDDRKIMLQVLCSVRRRIRIDNTPSVEGDSCSYGRSITARYVLTQKDSRLLSRTLRIYGDEYLGGETFPRHGRRQDNARIGRRPAFRSGGLVGCCCKIITWSGNLGQLPSAHDHKVGRLGQTRYRILGQLGCLGKVYSPHHTTSTWQVGGVFLQTPRMRNPSHEAANEQVCTTCSHLIRRLAPFQPPSISCTTD